MIGYVEAPRAWGLTRGMSRALGVNLAAAVMDGWLTRPELAELVDRCQACTRSGDCVGWLALNVSVAALPGYCANKTPLEALAH